MVDECGERLRAATADLRHADSDANADREHADGRGGPEGGRQPREPFEKGTRPAPLGPHLLALRRLRPHRLHQRLLELGRRHHGFDGPRQRLGHHPQLLDLAPAAGAAVEMALEHLSLELGQSAEKVGPHVLLVLLVVPAHAVAPAISLRIFSRPSRILPLTVPTGMSSISAICVCVKPP